MGDEVIKIGGRVDMGCLRLPERHAPALGGKEIQEPPPSYPRNLLFPPSYLLIKPSRSLSTPSNMPLMASTSTAGGSGTFRGEGGG